MNVVPFYRYSFCPKQASWTPDCLGRYGNILLKQNADWTNGNWTESPTDKLTTSAPEQMMRNGKTPISVLIKILSHFSSISQACCTQPGKACKKQNWCCKLLGSPSINTFFLGVPHVPPWTSNPNAVLSGSRLSRTWSTMKHLSFRNEAGSHWHWACHGYPTISRESCGILYGCQWVETTTELHLCFYVGCFWPWTSWTPSGNWHPNCGKKRLWSFFYRATQHFWMTHRLRFVGFPSQALPSDPGLSVQAQHRHLAIARADPLPLARLQGGIW